MADFYRVQALSRILLAFGSGAEQERAGFAPAGAADAALRG
jgi:hypothetical protein